MPNGVPEKIIRPDERTEKKILSPEELKAKAMGDLEKTLDTTAPKAIDGIKKEVENITKNEAFTKLAPEEQEAVRGGLKEAILNYVKNLKEQMGEDLGEEARKLEQEVQDKIDQILR